MKITVSPQKSQRGGCYDTAPSYHQLFDLWLDLLDFCRKDHINDKEFKKEFKNKQDAVNRIYKRMDYHEQGEFHKLVHDSHPKSSIGS